MRSMLLRLEGALQPHMRAAGLAQCDQAIVDDLSWLEYRDNKASQWYVLSIFHLSAERTVTAEAWRPDQVCQALQQGSLERAADQQHIWQYDEDADAPALEHEIVKTILGWVAMRLQPTS
jgi:hypothetical protein